MIVGSIFLILALAVLVGLFIARPFFQPAVSQPQIMSSKMENEEHERSSLLAERDRLLTSLQELDFDYRLGKIPEEDYPEMRASLVRATAQVLRNLDKIQGTTQTEDVEDRIELVIAARRADAAVTASVGAGSAVRVIAPPSDSIEERIAVRRRERREKATGFCPKCGKPALTSYRFCSKCGTAL
jgi:hypothetical protein